MGGQGGSKGRQLSGHWREPAQKLPRRVCFVETRKKGKDRQVWAIITSRAFSRGGKKG